VGIIEWWSLAEKIENGIEFSAEDSIRGSWYTFIPTLKKAIIDLFIAFGARVLAAEDETVVKKLLTKEEVSVQLHFLGEIVVLRSAKLLVFVEGNLLVIVTQLSKSEK
jgi:hypothetical protein